LGAVRRAHAEGEENYPGYRDGRVTPTTHNGQEAALWEFSWDGPARDGGPRHTYAIGWEEGGRTYDLWISASLGEHAVARRHFDTALTTFARTRPAS
jgi:hypothetical protein